MRRGPVGAPADALAEARMRRYTFEFADIASAMAFFEWMDEAVIYRRGRIVVIDPDWEGDVPGFTKKATELGGRLIPNDESRYGLDPFPT